MFERHRLREHVGNGWYARMLLAVSFAFLCYFTHMVGFEAVGYTGSVRRHELLVWLSVGASAFALYFSYRGLGSNGE